MTITWKAIPIMPRPVNLAAKAQEATKRQKRQKGKEPGVVGNVRDEMVCSFRLSRHSTVPASTVNRWL